MEIEGGFNYRYTICLCNDNARTLFWDFYTNREYRSCPREESSTKGGKLKTETWLWNQSTTSAVETRRGRREGEWAIKWGWEVVWENPRKEIEFVMTGRNWIPVLQCMFLGENRGPWTRVSDRWSLFSSLSETASIVAVVDIVRELGICPNDDAVTPIKSNRFYTSIRRVVVS